MLDAAVENNAAWCELVCRAHGLEPARCGGVWSVPRRPPRFYPDAMTLQAGVSADDLLAGVDAGLGCSAKDSFADVDLSGAGFEELFSAQWVGRAPAQDAPRLPWEVSREGAGPLDDSVRYLRGPNASAIVNRTASVVGLSNVEGEASVWADLPAAVGIAFPGLPIVGYEHGDGLEAALAAGFEPLGPLRVWMRPA